MIQHPQKQEKLVAYVGSSPMLVLVGETAQGTCLCSNLFTKIIVMLTPNLPFGVVGFNFLRSN